MTLSDLELGEDEARERVAFDHPIYILYSSGTTGVPKCIVHGAGGTLLQHLKEHQLQTDVKRGDKAPLAPLLRGAADRRLISGELFGGLWQDVGTVQRLAELETQLASRDESR